MNLMAIRLVCGSYALGEGLLSNIRQFLKIIGKQGKRFEKDLGSGESRITPGCVPAAVAGNNYFRDCSIVDSNSRRVSAA